LRADKGMRRSAVKAFFPSSAHGFPNADGGGFSATISISETRQGMGFLSRLLAEGTSPVSDWMPDKKNSGIHYTVCVPIACRLR